MAPTACSATGPFIAIVISAALAPFAGRLVHEGLATLCAFRLARLQPRSIGIAFNDYGFEMHCAEEFALEESHFLYESTGELDDMSAGVAPYVDRNPSTKPEDRKFMISIMTIHLMFWAVLTIIGSFFRGPGFNFTMPWDTGLTGVFHL